MNDNTTGGTTPLESLRGFWEEPDAGEFLIIKRELLDSIARNAPRKLSAMFVLALMYRRGRGGKFFGSVENLSDDLGIDSKQIRLHIKLLIQNDYLRKIGREGRRTVTYKLTPKARPVTAEASQGKGYLRIPLSVVKHFTARETIVLGFFCNRLVVSEAMEDVGTFSTRRIATATAMRSDNVPGVCKQINEKLGAPLFDCRTRGVHVNWDAISQW